VALINTSDPAGAEYYKRRVAHWDSIARRRDAWQGLGRAYHRRLAEVYRFLTGTGAQILEVGCGQGDLLGALRPARAVGVDFSEQMIDRARRKHPGIEFIRADAHDLSALNDRFDVIIFSDLVNDLWDVQAALEQVRQLCYPWTRLILNYYSGLWQLPLAIAQKLDLATRMLPQNWLTPEDVNGMLKLAGYEVIRGWHEVLLPLPYSSLPNKFLVRFWPFTQFALSNFVTARPAPEPVADAPAVTVIIPARNEAGNVRAIFDRVPMMGRATDLIFVEGHSRDDTYETIEREIALHPATRARLLRQQGIGKADAVRLGFADADGDILMILDADLTVRPEDLPRFYNALVSRQGEFINGVRLVYPMEKQAMQGLNLIGNKLFSLAFSWILGQPLKDTLCGTKAFWRNDYELIAANRSYFGEFDPFGDYDLIFGAAKLNRRIMDLPIRYRERTYGSTNISRWRHGALLVRMVFVAAARLKFV
jgi:SAM-dependent methyltransferase